MAECLDHALIVEGLHANLESFAFHFVLGGIVQDLVAAELEQLCIHGEECLGIVRLFVRRTQKNLLHLTNDSKEDRLGALHCCVTHLVLLDLSVDYGVLLLHLQCAGAVSEEFDQSFLVSPIIVIVFREEVVPGSFIA